MMTTEQMDERDLEIERLRHKVKEQEKDLQQLTEGIERTVARLTQFEMMLRQRQEEDLQAETFTETPEMEKSLHAAAEKIADVLGTIPPHLYGKAAWLAGEILGKKSFN
jgi:predicted  nucleic acid-binding Zn-ribbon protein